MLEPHIPPLLVAMRAAFVLCIFLMYCSLQAQDFELTSINLTVQDGLAGDNVYCAIQDDKGYVWFGTETGVSRYNGRVFENFYMSDGLADNEIFRIDQDSQGRVWFSAYNGRLSYYQNGKFFNPDNDSTLAGVNLQTYYSNFLEGSNGTVWFNSLNRASAITKAYEVRNYAFSEREKWISIFKEEDGVIKGATQVPLKEIQFTDAHGFLDTPIEKVITGDTIDFYESYLSGKEVVLMSSRQLFTGLYMKEFKGQEILPLQLVSKFHDYPNEPLWFCSYDGAFKLEQEEKVTEVYFKNKNVTHMLKDREGGYWFTTSGHGVFYTSSLSNRSVSDFNNDPIGNVSALLYSDGKIWFGGSNGKFGYIENDSITEGHFSRVAGRARIRQIVKGKRDKEVFIVAEELFARARDVETPDILRQSSKAMAYWQDSLVVLGMSRGFNVITQNTLYQLVDSLKDEASEFLKDKANNVFAKALPYAVIDIEEYQDGLLLSTSNGLYTLSKDLQYSRLRSHPIMREIINDIVVLDDDDYLLATHGLGTFFYKQGQWINFSTKEGLTSDIHKKIFVVSDSEFWIATNAGLNKVSLKGDVITTQSITKTDGLLSEDVSDVLLHEDKIYAATSKGISVVDLTSWEAKKTAPLINIKKLTEDGQVYADKNPVLSHNSKNIELTFDGIHFRSLDRVIYEYRLLGLDDSWSETSVNKVNFGSLRPGEYTFQVTAQSAFGNKSNISEQSFVIPSPIWNRWWFIGLLALAFIGLVIFVANLIIRRNKIKAQRALDFELRMAQAERKALQSQLNPHFIFNSLNSIQAMVLEKKPEEAYSYLEKFSRLIRRILEFSEKSMVSLNDELETLRLYMDLENLRLEGKFDYTISVADGVSLIREIPSLITQPYVENSIWHGIMPLEEKRGKIDINIHQLAEGLVIDIIDNGAGRKGPNAGMGTKIVSELVRKFKGDQSGEVEIEDLIKEGKPVGTKVSIRILEVVYD